MIFLFINGQVRVSKRLFFNFGLKVEKISLFFLLLTNTTQQQRRKKQIILILEENHAKRELFYLGNTKKPKNKKKSSQKALEIIRSFIFSFFLILIRLKN